jgi:Histidine kinase-, DNA gyrase B-, and HSP90-like ATPase
VKLRITGASKFTDRFFEAAGPYQWARECLVNSIEAGAKNIHFGIEWQGVEHEGVYRRYIADDGCGMDEVELREFFSTLGAGAKPIGGVHKNFGVGAKIASLPWNPNGVVVLSWKKGKASMIWMQLDPDSGDYELREFDTGHGATCVIDPEEEQPEGEIDWNQLKENLNELSRGAKLKEDKTDFITDHGTIIVFLGSDQYPDTVLGNAGGSENAIKGLSVYLNTRFWNLDRHVNVTVAELRSDKKPNWPQGPNDRDDSRRPNNRTALGARYFLTDFVSAQQGAGKAGPNGQMKLDDGRVLAEWFLWDGQRPTTIHAYAKEDGYVAVRYKDELFELTSHKHTFRRFGIVEPDVMRRLTIILTPQLYQPTNGCWGVHPDNSRNRLIFTGNGEKGVLLPIDNWAEEFANNLPEPILDAIKAARGASDTATIDDPEYRRRLAEKFGKRWNIPVLVKANPDDLGDRLAISLNGDTVKVYAHRKKVRTVLVKRKRKPPTPQPEPNAHGANPDGSRGAQRQLAQQEYRQRFSTEREEGVADENGTEEGVELNRELDIPRFVLTDPSKTAFEKPWHLALWQRREPTSGHPTVFINIASPILEQVVQYHAAHYAPHLTDEVRKTIHKVFGEVAACKIAHAQKLTIGPDGITTQDLDEDYLSEGALTIGLMGLIAEESLIGQRLGQLGPKRQQQTA